MTKLLYCLTLFAKTAGVLADKRHPIESGDLSAVKHNLVRIGETAGQALKEMRLLVHELRPLDLRHEGLVEALRRRLNAVEGRANVKARLVTKELGPLSMLVEEGLYRIAQEGLNNALKHAAATSVTVYLHLKDEADELHPADKHQPAIELEIVDDGVGFDLKAVHDMGGMGLTTMQERAERLGGSLTIHSSVGEGTRIQVRVNLSQ